MIWLRLPSPGWLRIHQHSVTFDFASSIRQLLEIFHLSKQSLVALGTQASINVRPCLWFWACSSYYLSKPVSQTLGFVQHRCFSDAPSLSVLLSDGCMHIPSFQSRLFLIQCKCSFQTTRNMCAALEYVCCCLLCLLHAEHLQTCYQMFDIFQFSEASLRTFYLLQGISIFSPSTMLFS